MARYDRIARIDPPARDHAYSGWLAVRDLQDRERDRDLGRRARLRFLTVRLVHRIARRGDDLDADSFQRQCDAVREELGQLPSRDPERHRLAEFLKGAPGLDVPAIVDEVIELGRAARDEDQPFAAEEFFRAGMELASLHGLDGALARGRQGLADLTDKDGASA